MAEGEASRELTWKEAQNPGPRVARCGREEARDEVAVKIAPGLLDQRSEKRIEELNGI
jgi:hypothetical protein